MTKEIEISQRQVQELLEMGLAINGPTLIVPPKPKIVKLSELPDGALLQVDSNMSACAYVHKGNLYAYRRPNGSYHSRIDDASVFIIIESPKQVWEGGPCPVPDGVVIRAWYLRDNEIQNTEGWLNLAEFFKNYRVLWYQILRLADDWELVK